MTRKKDEEPEQKDRVIHTRVPESLEAELRERAQKLGMSVSNLVRNVLGHAFGLVGDVMADGHAIARAAKGEGAQASSSGPSPSPSPSSSPGPSPAPDDKRDLPLTEVLGWQTVVLAKNAVCSRCNTILPKGTDAAVGMAERGDNKVIVCTACFTALR